MSALQALLRGVASEPWAYPLFALIRRIDALRPQAPATGHALLPAQEALRLGQRPELGFASADIGALDLQRPAAPQLDVHFFGLLGAQGPMPLHVTRLARDRLHQHRDPGMAHFFNLFHHRMLSLLYRAWAQAQPVVQADRPADDRFLAWLLAAAGAQVRTSGLPPRSMAFHAGWLAGRARHPEALCKVLQQQFGLPATLHTHVAQWLQIHTDDQTRLGPAGGGGAGTRPPPTRLAARLGHGALLGRKVWNGQARFTLVLAPNSLTQYWQLLPGGSDWAALNAWVRQLAPTALRWTLCLQLSPGLRPEARLGRPGVRLGVSTWLGRRPTQCLPAPPHRAAQHLHLRPGLSYLQHIAKG